MISPIVARTNAVSRGASRSITAATSQTADATPSIAATKSNRAASDQPASAVSGSVAKTVPTRHANSASWASVRRSKP